MAQVSVQFIPGAIRQVAAQMLLKSVDGSAIDETPC
jgi:hypothetical protein